jgi:hypothetical protein
MLFHYLLPDILYFFMLIPQHIVPIRLKLSRGIFDFFEIFLGVVLGVSNPPLFLKGGQGGDMSYYPLSPKGRGLVPLRFA